jgi:hypothetical protein
MAVPAVGEQTRVAEVAHQLLHTGVRRGRVIGRTDDEDRQGVGVVLDLPAQGVAILRRPAGGGDVVVSGPEPEVAEHPEGVAARVQVRLDRTGPAGVGELDQRAGVPDDGGAVGLAEGDASSPYVDAERRIRLWFAQGKQTAGDPDDVAAAIAAIIDDPSPPLRHPVGPDAPLYIDGRRRLSDETWIGLGRRLSDEDFFAEFATLFAPAPA